MKVAIVTDSYHPTRDGVVSSIDTVKYIFDTNGVESEIIAPDPGKDGRIEGVHYFKSVKFRRYAGYFVPIFPSHSKKVIREMNPDVVHIQGIAVMALKGLVAAHRLKIPVIVTFHTMVADTMKYYSPIRMPQKTAERLVWRYLKYFSRWVDAFVAPSQSTADELRAHGLRIRDLRIIPTPIDVRRFPSDADGSDIRKRYGIDDKKVVVCIGRVSFEKDIDLVIKAVAGMDEDVVLLIVGDGPAADSLKELAKRLGAEKRVIFAGFQTEGLGNFYCAGDAAVTASRFETQCLCALEAMHYGIPIACADARALADYIEDGVNGFLFDSNPESCAAALKKALNADDTIRKNEKKTASEFSSEAYLNNIMHLYADTIEIAFNLHIALFELYWRHID